MRIFHSYVSLPEGILMALARSTPLARQLVELIELVELQQIFNTNHEQSSCSLRFQASRHLASLEENSLFNFVQILELETGHDLELGLPVSGEL
jgi:hypothetical protein